MTPHEYREAVLDLVARIPRGRVMSYRAIAEHLAEVSGRMSPRLIGQIMARHTGPPVPWHRVVRSSGMVARGHEAEALRRLSHEGAPLPAGRVDMSRAEWDPKRIKPGPVNRRVSAVTAGRERPTI